MSKEENGKARDIIKKWMPIGIWIAAAMIVPYWLWIDEKKSLQSSLLNISALIPLFLLLSTLFIELGGYIMSGIMMAERLWKERKERIRKEDIASVISPLAVRVATGFILEHDSELGDKSDADLLEMINVFGTNKTFDIAADLADKDILEFVNSINHERQANRIAIKISDLMVNEDFANYVISLVRESQDMHIE